MKECKTCRGMKPLTEFYVSKLSADGLRRKCKPCMKDYRMQLYFSKTGRVKDIEDSNRDRLLLEKKLKDLKIKLNKKWRKTHIKCSMCGVWEIDPIKKSRCKSCNKKYQKDRLKNNPLAKMSSNIRSRTYMAFKAKSWRKNGRSEGLLGCTWEVAHRHLESQFTKGMTWSNHGEWHIDHIMPLSSAKTKEELEGLCHYTNLQPLWAFDNISKGNKQPFTTR